MRKEVFESFRHYSSGIYQEHNRETNDSDHGILAIGYSRTTGHHHGMIKAIAFTVASLIIHFVVLFGIYFY